MKPRIRLVFGVWVCVSYYERDGVQCMRMGDGYTPLCAFRDWETQA